MLTLMSGRPGLSKWMLAFAVFLILGLSSCQIAAPITSTPTGAYFLVSPTWPATPAKSPSRTQTPPTLEATSNSALAFFLPANSTPTPVFHEPAGCWQPPDDYTRVQINDHTINARTYSMLHRAAMLYGGEIDVAGRSIIQGSYSTNSMDSLGTHLGGGAVDISVMRTNTQYILYSDIEPLIRALRTVGFAAWLREDGEEGSGSIIHIHAVAIGDIDLSAAAQEQISGPAGYMRGYNGLPVTSEDPEPDRYGGPLICHWMLEAGYTDMRTPTTVPTPGLPWQERLRQAALAYQAFYPEDAKKIALSLNFLDGKSESAENICGPLSAAILRDAGLLPAQAGPVQILKSYWQASPSQNGRPWSLFPERDYEVFRFDTPLAEFDFTAWPLQPADYVYAYAKDHGFDHMFIVTEVDAEGRAYTVTNQHQSWGHEMWGSILILRYLLYDPKSSGEGIIYNEWSNPRLGMTGQNGFEVLRKRGLEAGSLYNYTIRPGDTLPDLAARFGAIPESLIQANPGMDLANLQIGQMITIPIPLYHPAPLE
ncbi:MAG: LysM peptidoglycan-binding domain-containing protein [Bellilinea sp.]